MRLCPPQVHHRDAQPFQSNEFPPRTPFNSATGTKFWSGQWQYRGRRDSSLQLSFAQSGTGSIICQQPPQCHFKSEKQWLGGGGEEPASPLVQWWSGAELLPHSAVKRSSLVGSHCFRMVIQQTGFGDAISFRLAISKVVCYKALQVALQEASCMCKTGCTIPWILPPVCSLIIIHIFFLPVEIWKWSEKNRIWLFFSIELHRTNCLKN